MVWAPNFWIQIEHVNHILKIEYPMFRIGCPICKNIKPMFWGHFVIFAIDSDLETGARFEIYIDPTTDFSLF